MRQKLTYGLIIFIILINSCKSELSLSDIGIKIYIGGRDSLEIVDGGNRSLIKYPDRENSWFCFPVPLNQSDSILVLESYGINDTINNIDGQLITMDNNCQVIDTIYILKPFESILEFSPSPNDSLILIHVCLRDSNDINVKILSEPRLYIYDMQSELIKKLPIPDSASIDNFEQTPWSPNSKSFVFSQDNYPYLLDSNFIQIYNLIDNSIISLGKGVKPIWHTSDNNQVLFKRDNSLIKYDILSNNNRIIYNPADNQKIDWFRFSSNKKYLIIHNHIEKYISDNTIDARTTLIQAIRLSDNRILNIDFDFWEGDYWK